MQYQQSFQHSVLQTSLFVSSTLLFLHFALDRRLDRRAPNLADAHTQHNIPTFPLTIVTPHFNYNYINNAGSEQTVSVSFLYHTVWIAVL
ncbi:unnamed protein product [Meloidogyne enterolobii]|uniref:Uncharacterized protein n=1 Tax=Meloidogyne enterolobii TaxID=390850 RepID=A0ACB0XX37_MELEN